MSQEDEILGKIEQQHQAGQHLTGPQAGCSLCAAMVERGEPPIGEVEPEQAIDLLARRAAKHAPQVPPRHPTVPSEEEIASWGDRDAPTLGDVALIDAQTALDQIEALGLQGIVIPNEKVALVHGVVGVVRALAGIEETLRGLLDALSNDPEVIDPSELQPDQPIAQLREDARIAAQQPEFEPPPDAA